MIQNLITKKRKKKSIDKDKTPKTSMSFLASLSLSFNNLMTKKGRTFLTAFAGSMGIIGIALILALSNGVSGFVSYREKESLQNFPLTVEEEAFNVSTYLTDGLFGKDDDKCPDNKLCSKDDINSEVQSLTNDIVKQNNMEEFKKYVDETKGFTEYASQIQYSYNLDLQIYSTKNDNYVRVNPNSFNLLTIANVKDTSGELAGYIDTEPQPIFTELLESDDNDDSKYEVLAGHYPKNYNELVLIVDENGVIPDSVLYGLDIKDRNQINEVLGKDKKIKATKYNYDEILNTSYKLVLNTDYYKKVGGVYRDYSSDNNYMKNIIDNGVDMTIVGIVKVKGSADQENLVGYKHSLVDYVIENVAKTDIYREQTENKDINVLTGLPFDNETNNYESVCKTLGIVDVNKPNKISFYPKDFESKDKIVELMDKYNKKQEKAGHKENVISYTDLLKTLISSITSVVNIITYVLIAFVAISLIVSSIMIAIITHISVLERTKEIGILRAIGASKKDVKRVFRAETIIEGFVAGVMGVIMCILVSFVINKVVAHFMSYDNIAHLPLLSAVLLIALSTLLTVLAGRRPSKMASKKDPVEALRTE